MDQMNELEAAFAEASGTESTRDLNGLLSKYKSIREATEIAKREFDDLSKSLEQLEGLLLTKMDELGYKSVRDSDGVLFSSCTKHAYSLPPKSNAQGRAEAIAWLRSVGAGDFIEEQIHYQTLNSFIKGRVENDDPVSELISDYPKRYLSVRK